MASGGDAPHPDAVLSGARACYHQKQEGDTYICGLELIYSHVQLDPWNRSVHRKKCGKIVNANMSEEIGFSDGKDAEHIIGVEFIKRLMFVKIGIHLILLLVMPRYSDVMSDDTSRLCNNDKWFKSEKQVFNFLGYQFPAVDDCAPTSNLD